MSHWNRLNPSMRELLGKLVEGHGNQPTDDTLATLMNYGLVEHGPDGWQVTQAGRSTYVVRDGPIRSTSSLTERWGRAFVPAS